MEKSDKALLGAFQAIDDPQERLANLTTLFQGLPRTTLFQGLSPWERRHSRTQLGDRDGLATLEDMPVDIACLLVRHIHIEDVLALAAVSTRCRTTWTEPSVASAISFHFFPALQAPVTFLSFERECRKYLRRRAGKFTSRLDLALPFQSDDIHVGLPLSNWHRDYKDMFSPDPVLHPQGYPKAWLEISHSYFGCYGGGNLVWYALPDFFVVENLYSRTRKVVKIPGGMKIPAPWDNQIAASKCLVALQPHSKEKLLIYDIETNTITPVRLPIELRHMVIRGRRTFLSLPHGTVCVLDHDGTRVHTKLFIKVDEGLDKRPGLPTETECEYIHPHPQDDDRFFIVLVRTDDNLAGPPANNSKKRIVVVREYHISRCPEDNGEGHSGSQSGRFMDNDMCMDIHHRFYVNALDDHGSCGVEWWIVRKEDPEAAKLPPLPQGFRRYHLQTSFNAITKEVVVQRHCLGGFGFRRPGPPWIQQVLVPHVPRPGLINIRRFDADYASFVPTGVSWPETRGEREVPEGWTIEFNDVDQNEADVCEFFHDEDFTVYFMKDYNRVYVWAFAEDVQGEGDASSGSGDGPSANPS